MSTARAPSLVEIIQATVQPLAAVTPAPRTRPYLGLDHPSGTSLDLLDAVAARGIFRKYEEVLDLGTPLGAASRWMAARLGCEAVAAAPTAAAAHAAALLTRRTPLRGHVRCLAATPHALPFPNARFTHVWIVEALEEFAHPAAALVEAHRVVRPGGWLAVQALLGPGRGGTIGAMIDAAGFLDTQCTDVTAQAVDHGSQSLAARARLHRQLHAAGGALAEIARTREAQQAAIAAGTVRVLQLVARRPG